MTFTKKSISLAYLFILVCLINVQSLFAQPGVPLQINSDPYYPEAFSKYNAETKPALPEYFFPTVKGGGCVYEPQPEIGVMVARQWVVPVPVIIFAMDEQASKATWMKAINNLFKNDSLLRAFYKDETSAENSKDGKVQTKADTQEQPKLDPQQAKMAEKAKMEEEDKILAGTNVSAADRARIMAERANRRELIKKAEMEAQANAAVVEKLPKVMFPLWVAEKLKTESLEWLYVQQIMANNVFYCDAETKIPFVVPNERSQTQERQDYALMLTVWKQAYSFLLTEKVVEEKKSAEINTAGMSAKELKALELKNAEANNNKERNQEMKGSLLVSGSQFISQYIKYLNPNQETIHLREKIYFKILAANKASNPTINQAPALEDALSK